MKYKLDWDKHVDIIENDFTGGSDYILTLPNGFKFSHDSFFPTHVRGYDSKRELIKDLKHIVSCNCKECMGG